MILTRQQMNTLDVAHYRRHCLMFLNRELEMLDSPTSSENLRVTFENLSAQLDLINRWDRLTLTLLLILRFSRVNIFNPSAIDAFLSQSALPNHRYSLLARAARQHARYDADYLERKAWI